MNFTKPGVTGGRGYKSGEYNMRIMVRSKKNKSWWMTLKSGMILLIL